MAPNISGRGRHQKIMSWVKSLLTTEQKHFIIVGLVNTILSYALFSVLLYFQLSYVLSYWISMCAGVLNSYILNKFWTFRVYRHSIMEFVRFVLVYLMSFLIGTCTLYCLVSIFKLDAHIAGLINLFLTALISWLGHKYFSFR